MFTCNLLARICTGMIRSGSAPLHHRTPCRARILVQQYRMNKPLATIMRALFTRGALGHYHSSVHPLCDPILQNPIRIVNLDGDSCRWELEETLGADDLCKMHSHVHEAWNTMQMDLVLLRQGNITMEEGLLVCHFLELAFRRGNYLARTVAVVTTHCAQMVWLQWCVRYVGSKWQATQVPILLTVATWDRFQGLQAPVIFASVVSATQGSCVTSGVKHTNQQGTV